MQVSKVFHEKTQQMLISRFEGVTRSDYEDTSERNALRHNQDLTTSEDARQVA